MSETVRSPFQERLNALFERGFPDGQPATPTEVARRAAAAGFQVSRPYIGQLRSGRARNPALATIEALATVFDVEPNYFFGRESSTESAAHDTAMAAVHDPDALISGIGGALDAEGRRQLAYYLKFLQFEQERKKA